MLRLSPAAVGAACCVISTLGYSAANVFMRRMSELGCDPTWAMCNKELVTVLVVGPWLVVEALRGRATLPKGRPLVLLVLVGLATQLGGNAPMQWAYGVAGLAVMIPAMFAFMLTAAAILGWMLLGERVAMQTAAAIGILLGSLGLLGLGTASASHQAAAAAAGLSDNPLMLGLAVGVACMAGIIYALLSITIRHCVTGTTRLTAVAIIITGMGVVSLAPLSVYRLGMDRLLETPPEQFGWMLAAGTCNLIAFLALTRSLQLISVVHVNVLNAAQVALSAVGGMLIFHEPHNPWLVLGIVLTIVGIFSIGRPQSEQVVDQHV
jgi:drug/metabolite transporter (DMT)-like permease